MELNVITERLHSIFSLPLSSHTEDQITYNWQCLPHRCLHTEDEYFLKSMKEAIHEILTDVSDFFSHMIDMALANEIQVIVGMYYIKLK